jgi:hypothetical protein
MEELQTVLCSLQGLLAVDFRLSWRGACLVAYCFGVCLLIRLLLALDAPYVCGDGCSCPVIEASLG